MVGKARVDSPRTAEQERMTSFSSDSCFSGVNLRAYWRRADAMTAVGTDDRDKGNTDGDGPHGEQHRLPGGGERQERADTVTKKKQQEENKIWEKLPFNEKKIENR